MNEIMLLTEFRFHIVDFVCLCGIDCLDRHDVSSSIALVCAVHQCYLSLEFIFTFEFYGLSKVMVLLS
jgi:hypothetical protein